MLLKKYSTLIFITAVVSILINIYFFTKDKIAIRKISSPQDLGSYAISYKLISDLKSQGIQLNSMALELGLQDALANKSKYSYSELVQFEAQLKDLSAPFISAIAEKNRILAQEFFAQNKSRDGINETQSGLQYSIQSMGSGLSPKPTDLVKISYVVKYLDGKIFEDSRVHGDWVEIPVTNAPLGMQEALLKMKAGSHWTIYVPPTLAYGAVPRQGVPPNSVLIIDLSLKEITKK